MFKNVASQKVAVFAWDNAAGVPKTGDAANISAQISKDGAACAATNDAAPAELDAVDAPGIYLFDMTQAETNADLISITPDSSTTDVVFRPIIIYTNVLTSTKADYIEYLMVALVNKMIITENTGNTEMFNDADGSLGSIASAFATDGTYTTRQRLVI